ncbi:cysteine hydrolase [Vibrio splendidus]|uniref:cysteine hydrolase n=1 Tax=Vibrio splendidus TaxID=29497 RepID=UPI00223565C1|nr:cysteine hydrolase [Vibrio splendidus]MCW4444173.1 cysteine hydrolase [Vibrio splendidus]
MERTIIEGKPALIVIDIQAGSFVDIPTKDLAIAHMPNFKERLLVAREAIDQARLCGIPVIFVQEVHRPDMIDFGRELDGSESVHCLESKPTTSIAVEQMGFLKTDYVVKKRRYSAFFSTDLEILLKGLGADTLILCGALTDVCVHYTFVDAHQSDYFCRVIEEAVAGSSSDAHDASLAAMEYLQKGAVQSLTSVKSAMDDFALSSFKTCS